MNRVTLLTLSLLVGISACPLPAQGLFVQTLPPGLATVEGNDSLSIPFTTTSDNKWQFAFDSSLFNVQAPIIIRNVRVRADGGQGLAGFDLSQVGLTLASATADHAALSTTNLASNLATDQNNWRFPQPFVSTGVPANPCGSSQPLTVLQGGFQVYDPRLGQDFIIEITACGVNTPWSVPLDAQNGSSARRYGDPTNCAANASTINDDRVPVFFIEYATSEEWETNEAGASLTINGVNNNAVTKLQVQTCTSLVNVLRADSTTLVGNGWEIGVINGPGTPASANGFRSTSGQIINLDLSQQVFFLNGLTFSPITSGFSLPLQFPAPAVASAQLLVLDPSSLDGSELSALCEIDVVGTTIPPSPSVMGPTGDDSSLTVPIGCFPFFGTVYTDVHVSSNGRVMFGGPDTSPAPLSSSDICQDNAFIGYWADLDPSAPGASITVSDGGNRLVRISYANVPFAGETVPNSFAIELDGSTGRVALDGLLGISQHPAPSGPMDNALLGISGGLGNLTNPGSAPFIIGGAYFPASGRDAIYEFGVAGFLAPGVNRITFQPIKSGALANNYLWTVQ